MQTGTFPQVRNGYHPFVVDAYISKLETRQQYLLDKVETLKVKLDKSAKEASTPGEQPEEVEALKVRLEESEREAAALRAELEEVEALRVRLEESAKDAAPLGEQLEEVEALKVRLEESEREAAALRAELAEAASLRADLEEVEALRVRLAESERQAAALGADLEEVEALKARLAESESEAASLKEKFDSLVDNSASPHAMADRVAKILRIAVDEAAEMRTETETLTERIAAEVETARRNKEEMLADMAAQRSAFDIECEQTRKELHVELARMRAEAESAADYARQVAHRQSEKLVHDAKNEADRYLERARRVVEEASQQRSRILNQMMSLCQALENIPTTLDGACEKNGDAGNSVIPFSFEKEANAGPESPAPPRRTNGEVPWLEAIG